MFPALRDDPVVVGMTLAYGVITGGQDQQLSLQFLVKISTWAHFNVSKVIQ